MANVGTEPLAGRTTYVGLFLITLATLMYEILLTRIFSVTLHYHSAFVAISVAMFGMTVGALIVYLVPKAFAGELVHKRLVRSALLFAVFMIAALIVHILVPFHGWHWKAITYLVLATPFTFSGIVVCLALTKFPFQVGRLYAADLFGAALGCLLLLLLLDITDAGTAVVISAGLAALGAALFSGAGVSRDGRAPVARVLALLIGVSALGFAVYNTGRVHDQSSLLRLLWVKGKLEIGAEKPELIRWNAFSRIQVQWVEPTKPDTATKPVGWGLSPKAPYGDLLRQRYVLIDASAATVMTEFAGDLSELAFLKYDITNLGHHVRNNARVLVIGAGGGRDLLSALVFDQREVVGVEINKAILDIVNGHFGDFTGHLDEHPKIKLVNDEARSFMARQQDNSFDIVQVSLIDTWAATAAGAFVLTENSLYTVEAWQLFLHKLTDRGLLSFSRWYHQDRPGEAYRITSLASAALRAGGIQDPRKHIVVAKLTWPNESNGGPDGTATILVSKQPFQKADLDQLALVSKQMGFEIIVSPTVAEDATFARLADGKDLERFTSSHALNIAPPTDNSPFFFNLLRLSDFFTSKANTRAAMEHNLKAVDQLATLVLVVFVLTFLCIVVPLLLTARRVSFHGSLPLFLFFGGIGLGFLLIEISQMQRLILFLGHPTYGLAVVLFAMLVSSGLGSWLSQGISSEFLYRRTIGLLTGLLAVLLVFGTVTTGVIRTFEGSTTLVRILISIVLLFPLGLLMGTAFPLGMRMSRRVNADLTPWLWGINGATSVCASVLATAISLAFGIAAAFWTGCCGYVLALLSVLVARARATG